MEVTIMEDGKIVFAGTIAESINFWRPIAQEIHDSENVDALDKYYFVVYAAENGYRGCDACTYMQAITLSVKLTNSKYN